MEPFLVLGRGAANDGVGTQGDGFRIDQGAVALRHVEVGHMGLVDIMVEEKGPVVGRSQDAPGSGQLQISAVTLLHEMAASFVVIILAAVAVVYLGIEGMLEAQLGGMVGDMPFAGKIGFVACVPELLRQGSAGEETAPAGEGFPVGVARSTGAGAGVLAGEQAAAGRRTQRAGRDRTGKAGAFPAEPVHIGG